MRSTPVVAAGLLIAAIGSGEAHACSMAPGYKVPTNLELVAGADAIAIATIVGERTAGDPWDGTVLLESDAALKGMPPRTFGMRGAYLARSKERPARQSDPRELRAPNPDAMTGGCIRYVFAKGTKLVLFLKRDDKGVMLPWRSSFSRDAEDVSGGDALWVKAVREYVGIAATSRASWPDRLRERAAVLRATGDADAVAIAADMDVERSGRRREPYD